MKVNNSEGNEQSQQQSSPSSSVMQNGATPMGLPLPKCFSENKVKKSSSPTNSGHKLDSGTTQEEMQSLLAKLKDLVPNMPRNKKLSKLEIIQYVIDYIFDLQLALEAHPSTTSPITKAHNTCLNSSPSSSSSNRQPLGLLSPSSIIN